jgi:hypothetical protein
MSAKPKNQSVTIQPSSAEMRSLYRAFKQMDKEVSKELKAEVYKISDYVARNIRAAAETAPLPAQARAVAATTKARKDRVPTIVIGGNARARVSRKGTASNPKPYAGDLVFGSEFGMRYDKQATLTRRYKDKQGRWRTKQGTGLTTRFPNGGAKFPTRSPREGQGNAGYWIFPTLKRLQPRITRDYHEAVYRFLTKTWGK